MATYASLKYAFGAQLTGEIPTAAIADDAVTLAKMASGTDGNVITYDASGNPAVVASGSSGQFLKSQGADTVPVFAADNSGKVIRWKRYVATNGYGQGNNGSWAGFDNYTTIDCTSSSTILYVLANWGNVRICENTEPVFAHGISNALDGSSGSSWSGSGGDAGGSGNQFIRCKHHIGGTLESATCANDGYGFSCFLDGRWTSGQTSTQSIGRSQFVTGKYTTYNGWTASTPQNNSAVNIFELETES